MIAAGRPATADAIVDREPGRVRECLEDGGDIGHERNLSVIIE